MPYETGDPLMSTQEVGAALARITERDIVELGSERKAAMVSNLMVVVCGDRAPQPVLNTGPLHQ